MQAAYPLTDRALNAVLFHLPGKTVSAAAFAADAMRLAAQLAGEGHVLNLCRDRYAFAVGFAAALLRGHCSLLASDRTPESAAAMLRRFPGTTIVSDVTFALPAISVPPPGDGQAAIPVIRGDLLAALVFTSGSTGEPVAHGKTWGALVERSRAAASAFGLQDAPAGTIVGTVPPQHMYGFETTVLLPLHAACAAWCGPAFFPADIRAALAGVPAPRTLVTTPLQLRTLLEADGHADVPMPALSRVISATAPLDPAMARSAEARWHTTVSEIFGATEVGSIAHRRTADGPDWTPYPGVELRQQEDCVVVDAPGASLTTLDDRLDIRASGHFRLLSRRSDLVKLAGRRASLAGLNRALTAVAGVQDGAFVPPDAGDHRAAARMVAVVVAPGAAPAAILAGLRERIDPAFLPRRIVQVDRLPRNELGKLPMGALLALAS